MTHGFRQRSRHSSLPPGRTNLDLCVCVLFVHIALAWAGLEQAVFNELLGWAWRGCVCLLEKIQRGWYQNVFFFSSKRGSRARASSLKVHGVLSGTMRGLKQLCSPYRNGTKTKRQPTARPTTPPFASSRLSRPTLYSKPKSNIYCIQKPIKNNDNKILCARFRNPPISQSGYPPCNVCVRRRSLYTYTWLPCDEQRFKSLSSIAWLASLVVLRSPTSLILFSCK